MIFNLDRPCQFNFRKSITAVKRYDSRPRHIAAGDFNHDGYLDLVVANSGIDNIGVLINDRNGTFHSQITFPTGTASRPYSLAVGHLNNDIHLDVVVANFDTNSIGVLFGDGNGTFATPLYTSLGSSRPLSLALAHFNNDSALDVVVANYATFTIAVLLGDNSGFFQLDSVYEMGYDSMPYSIAVADINQDHRLDIIAVNYGTSELAILLADGNQSFVLHKYWTDYGSHPSSFTTAHLNNDDLLDIVIAYSDTSKIGIFLGTGNGTFINHMTYPLDTGSRPQFIAVDDFDNDTYVDITVLDSANNNLLILKANNNGSFLIITRHSTGYNSDPSAMVLADFDNDDHLDIAISNNRTNNVHLLTVYLTFPKTHFAAYKIENYVRAASMDIADFNDDNYLDIIISDYVEDYTGLFLNLGNGTFNIQQIQDMNNFSSQQFIVAGDVNNDHHQDIVLVMAKISSIGILLGYGNGSFARGYQFPIGSDSTLYSISLDDLNNDGHVDIILGSADTGFVYFFWGLGNGTFTNRTTLRSEIEFYAYFVKVADTNNDTILDLLAAVDIDDNGILVFLGYGNGSFHSPLFVSTDNDFPNTFIAGDVNSDGRTDIVYTNLAESYVGVLLGDRNGSFEPVTKYFTIRGGSPRSISLGYYNDDTFLDIAVSLLSDASINIYLGSENGFLKTPTRLSTGQLSAPRSVMFADLDNDHQQDIVVGEVGINTVDIFLVYSTSDFTDETSYITGSNPRPVSVSIDDLNNDQQSEVVVVNSGTNEIQVLMNFSGDRFLNRQIYTTGFGSHPQSVAIADFNEDHLFDIAVVNSWNDSINIFLGLFNGSFGTGFVYSTGENSAPYSVANGDLNKDGRMDIVSVNEGTNSIDVFIAFDYVSFTSHVIEAHSSLSRPFYLTTADFNNDHLVDIAVFNLGLRNLDIYLGYGNGTFSEQLTVEMRPESSAFSFAVGDFNNDSCLDLVVANSILNTMEVYLGYGNGSFQPPIFYSTGHMSSPYSVSITDFNNDRHLDIIVSASAKTIGGNLWVFLGRGNGTFEGRIIYSLATHLLLVQIVITDLNNDGAADVVLSDIVTNSIWIIFGDGNGSIDTVTILSTGKDFFPVTIASADLNRDGSVDIAVTNSMSNTIKFFFNDGNGSFSTQKTYSARSDTIIGFIITSDVNNDGFLDIVVTDNNYVNNHIFIFYGFGDGNFTLPKYYPTGLSSVPSKIATGDFNNDGKVDLATCYTDRGRIALFIQEGSEPFGSPAQFSTGNQSRPNSIVISDFNSDDHLDIAVANSAINTIGIFFGYGNGNFTDPMSYSTGLNSLPSSIVADHLNGDQYLDIAVLTTADDNLIVFLGDRDGRFTQWKTYSTGLKSAPVAIASKDMNKDGYVDLVVANRGSNEVLIFVGIGNGTFDEVKRYPLGYNTRPQFVAIGDVNNDGMLDIAVANDEGGYVEILLQTC